MTGSKLTFVYDDFSHVLIGKWYKGTMVGAKRAKIKAYRLAHEGKVSGHLHSRVGVLHSRCQGGLLRLRTSQPHRQSALYFFERPSVGGFITSHPTVINAFDMHSVYIENSRCHVCLL